MILITLFLLFFSGCILTNSALSLNYAGLGLKLWLDHMIPALFPFMVLSGVMVRMGLTEKIAMAAYPVIRPVYKVRKNVCYCMLLGFLCGFPMGARVAADLRERNLITQREGEFLLSFCNNIGPVYFVSFALPLLGRRAILPYLFGMYGIPLLYGWILRYTGFRHLEGEESATVPPFGSSLPARRRARLGSHRNPSASRGLRICENGPSQRSAGLRFLEALEESVGSSLQSILTLGGYMILFNLMNLIPHVLFQKPLPLLSPLLEITGGLGMLGDTLPLYSLLALSFGGLSCIAQTYSCIRKTDLSITSYIVHKTALTVCGGFFYLLWFVFSPGSFLR